MNMPLCRLIALCLLLPAIAPGQPANNYSKPVLAHVGINQGLSNNSVRCIYQDHNGFIWFGTYDGLNRYDGYTFKVFRNKLNNTASLPHNYIYAIHEDQSYRLWVGTGQGLVTYNPLLNSFDPAWFRPEGYNSAVRVNANVNCIQSDTAGAVFIGTNGWGLLTQGPGQDTATQVPLQIGGASTTGYNVQALAVDSQQRVWLFILETGLCVYDKTTHQIRVVNQAVRSASCLAPDSTGTLWIGTPNGLYKYAMASNALAGHLTETNGALPSNRVVSLCFDQQQHLWIGTDGGGIAILNIADGQLNYLQPGENTNSLASESVFSIHADQENRIWIGTLKGGVNIVDWQKSRFQTYTHARREENSLVNNFVASFYEDNNHKDLWIGTDGGGFSIWDRNTNRFINYRCQASNPRGLSHNSVSYILKDQQDKTWLATFGGGINRFNRSAGTFEHFRCINQETGEENRNVLLLFEDREQRLWATTFGNGKLYLFNPAAQRFEAFDQQLNDLISLTQDHAGYLWAGNSYQLIRIDTRNRKHSIYDIGKPIRSIYEDSNHRLWIGTEGGGLLLFDRQQEKLIKRYSDADGLCNNAVLNILEDNDGILWISTFNGLSRFDPAAGKFRNFYQSDGLQSSQFSYNAALKLHSGQLVFGGIGGFNLFNPRDILPRSYMPPVLFTDMHINNRGLSHLQPYIDQSTDGAIQSLRIPYDQAVLSFTFTALEYTSSEKIRYAYYLEGWDKDWNYTGSGRTINYNNITEGSYRLRVKSTNAEGVWNERETVLSIRILPPWYRTVWAYLFYFVTVVSLIYTWYRYRNRQQQLQYAIQLAQLDAEKEKEINEKRQAFFTHVSHEFRTPLTLIINPIKDLLKKQSSPAEQGELNVVYRNARRLLSLIDQLLLFRKAEEQADQLHIAPINITRLCKEVFLCFVQQAKARQIRYEFHSAEEELEIQADREKMEIVFYNLLSNALKYTPDGGAVTFTLTGKADTVEAIVADTGIGLTPEAASRLFEKFYQVKDKSAPTRTGFGIGLYLVKHSVDRHQGQISFASAPGAGTSFTITLPKGQAQPASQLQPESQPASAAQPEQPVFLEELAANEADLPEAPATRLAVTEKMGLESVITDRESVLVIDDNEAMRQYVAGIFHDQFTVYEAASAEAGLELARKYLPDLIISDVVMGDMTGIELCRIIKETPALNHIPVILLTGSFSPDSRLKGVEGGADDYITKPFEKDLLQARVSSLLKNRQNLQRYFYNEITHQENPLKIPEEYKAFLEQCIAIVERNIDNEEFTIQVFATEIGMSYSKLYKKIKAISGQSANAFIRFIRLRKAAELFINTNYNVNETAFYVGIRDVKYFREQFYKTFGLKPSEYIEKYRKVFGKNYQLNEKAHKEKEGL
ncbi:MAG: two-component regulator propeller domain-containing protein [Candidatus Pseudobacter hemicellulosilyticus]|uniref:histidine kinase n=1 Tax=Candidatus Pseudobacter hemicellulosilyticus TaxID=3121375 RepID=A0AAJ5WMW7_9BACT|nr:MAG: two-component regulator propeller domain-containing protein [Pseudobacter sp.]